MCSVEGEATYTTTTGALSTKAASLNARRGRLLLSDMISVMEWHLAIVWLSGTIRLHGRSVSSDAQQDSLLNQC